MCPYGNPFYNPRIEQAGKGNRISYKKHRKRGECAVEKTHEFSLLRKSSHTVHECKRHVIWYPEYRYRVMDGEIRLFAREEIRRLSGSKNLTVI